MLAYIQLLLQTGRWEICESHKIVGHTGYTRVENTRQKMDLVIKIKSQTYWAR